jgi:hypothetical protein
MHCSYAVTIGRGRPDVNNSLLRLIITAVFVSSPLLADAPAELISHRHVIDDIHESVYSVRTGNGGFGRIQLHRVVKEEGGEPLERRRAVMLVHGDVWGFNAAFMPADSPRYSLPVYLAARGTDVWGIDLAWTLVPQSTTDFAFMRDWGLQHDIDDVNTALDTAEKIRKHHAPFTVLGWSRGAVILYGLLNQESQRPCGRRRVKGAIPFDGALKFADPGAVAFSCSQAAALEASLRAGQFGTDFTVWSLLGSLAEEHPDDPSPLLGPPFTNRQALLQIGAAAFALFGPSVAPQYHFVAGVFPNDDLTQIPTSLQYTDLSRFVKFARAANPYMPTRMLRDSSQISCESGPTGPFDNSLRAIQIPILYVGARGGFGTSGLATLNLLGSTNIETLMVSLRPQNQAGLDFGHVDLVHARNAEDLVWSGIDRWLAAHAEDGVCVSR